MRIKFTCANCLKETEFSSSVSNRVSLVCQKCGCADIKFPTKVIATPANPGQPNVQPIEVPADTPFLGRTPYGELWSVTIPSEEKKDPLPPIKSRRK